MELSEPSTTRSEERSLAERLLAKHMHEEHHSTLTVSILEARGLSPRQGNSFTQQAILFPLATNFVLSKDSRDRTGLLPAWQSPSVIQL